jgi:hypothetical protein
MTVETPGSEKNIIVVGFVVGDHQHRFDAAIDNVKYAVGKKNSMSFEEVNNEENGENGDNSCNQTKMPLPSIRGLIRLTIRIATAALLSSAKRIQQHKRAIVPIFERNAIVDQHVNHR